MSAQVLTKPNTRQEWLARLAVCQQQILNLQEELLEALPSGASLSYLSSVNDFRGTLIKNLEQVDNFRYQLTLQDLRFRGRSEDDLLGLTFQLEEFFEAFNLIEGKIQTFVK